MVVQSSPWGEHGPAALAEAIREGDARAVAKLISAGVDVNDREDLDEDTPLMISVQTGDLEMVRMLVEAGADPDLASPDWPSALHCAVFGPSRPIYKFLAPLASAENRAAAEELLARRNALKGAAGKPNRDLLKAAKSGDVASIRRAIADGANPHVLDREGFGPLHRAVLGSRYEAVEALLDAGSSPNLFSGDGAPPLFYTTDPQIIQMLLARGAHIDGGKGGVGTALHRSAALGDAEWATFLLGAGADRNAVDSDGETPRDKALRMRQAHMLDLLS